MRSRTICRNRFILLKSYDVLLVSRRLYHPLPASLNDFAMDPWMDATHPSRTLSARLAAALSLRQFELVQSLRFREVRGEHRAPQQTRVLRLQARSALHHLGSRQVGSERELGVLGVEIVLVETGPTVPRAGAARTSVGSNGSGDSTNNAAGGPSMASSGRASSPASGARPAATKHGFTSASSNANLFACRAYSTSSSSNSDAVSSRRVLFRSASVLSANRTIRFAIRSSTLGTDSAGMQSTNSSRRNAAARARAAYVRAYLRRAYASGSSVLETHVHARNVRERLLILIQSHVVHVPIGVAADDDALRPQGMSRLIR